jgi:hypothetical protein
MWQHEDASNITGARLANRLLLQGTYEFPVETLERSSIGDVIHSGLDTWQRIK